jgi:hypothetical protein
MVSKAQEGMAPEPLSGAMSQDEMLTDEQEERLNYYRRLASAFRQVEGRKFAQATPGGP